MPNAKKNFSPPLHVLGAQNSETIILPPLSSQHHCAPITVRMLGLLLQGIKAKQKFFHIGSFESRQEEEDDITHKELN